MNAVHVHAKFVDKIVLANVNYYSSNYSLLGIPTRCTAGADYIYKNTLPKIQLDI